MTENDDLSSTQLNEVERLIETIGTSALSFYQGRMEQEAQEMFLLAIANIVGSLLSECPDDAPMDAFFEVVRSVRDAPTVEFQPAPRSDN